MFCKKGIVCLSVSALFCAVLLYSQEQELSVNLPKDPHRLYIGPTAAWYDSTFATDQAQSGPMYGATAGYDYLKNSSVYVGAHANYLAGKLTGSFGNDFTQEFSTEGRIGYRISMGQEHQFSWAPFTGYGYLVFLQDIGPGPEFRYRFMYIPLGFRATWQPLNYLEVGMNAMGGIPFSSKWSVSSKQSGDTRFISYIELPFRFFLTPQSKRFDLSLVPYWRNWSIRSKGSLIGQVNNIVGARIEIGFNL